MKEFQKQRLYRFCMAYALRKNGGIKSYRMGIHFGTKWHKWTMRYKSKGNSLPSSKPKA